MVLEEKNQENMQQDLKQIAPFGMKDKLAYTRRSHLKPVKIKLK